ncbi:EF-hand calcium-binding domain-containing protein 1, partial [Quaeritorhiza haematococci]
FRCFDLDADNHLSYDEFIKGMSTFLKGKFEERMKFCFRVYDLNGDRYISKEEMYQMLKNSLVRGAEEDEDGVKDLVDLVLKKLDEDRDGRVSEADWAGAITKETLLMEAFGPCLPTSRAVTLYLNPNADLTTAQGSAKNALLLHPHHPSSQSTSSSTLNSANIHDANYQYHTLLNGFRNMGMGGRGTGAGAAAGGNGALNGAAGAAVVNPRSVGAGMAGMHPPSKHTHLHPPQPGANGYGRGRPLITPTPSSPTTKSLPLPQSKAQAAAPAVAAGTQKGGSKSQKA